MKNVLVYLLVFADLGFFPTKSVAQMPYPFIRYNLNKIILPPDSSSWLHLAEKFDRPEISGNFNILHFGDSHIQGDYFTGRVRKLLFDTFKIGTGSRGITMPYKVAGTNGPDDLFSSSQGLYEKSSVRKANLKYHALTGYCITALDTLFTISLKDTSNYRFNKVYIFHSPLNIQKIQVNGTDPSSTTCLSDSLCISSFTFPELRSSLNLQVLNSSLQKKTSLYGFSLQNSAHDVSLNSIGVNGATFGTFLKLQDSRKIIDFLKPDCVVFSMGTNEAINNNIDTILLVNQISLAINIVRSAVPGIPIILTTPGDHLIKRQLVNSKTALVARLIKETAMRNNCAFWDFYNVMGGKGSIREWHKNQLAFRDYIHLSKKGYQLQGDLFFAAFIKLKDLKNE